MKVYQIISACGEYEDYREQVEGTYLNKKRAEQDKKELEEKELSFKEQYEICEKCPYQNLLKQNFNKKKVEAKNFCKMFSKTREIGYYWCANRVAWYDETSFMIREFDVVE